MTLDALAHLDELIAAPEFLSDPYPAFDRLRAEAPVFWSDVWNCWLVTSYDLVNESFRDHVRFSNVNRFAATFTGLPDDVFDEIRPLHSHFNGGRGLIHADPPTHTRLRRLIHLVFTPRVVQKMREQVQHIVDQHLDVVQARGGMDVVRDLAFPLPATVIATMLGVPLEDMERLKTWSQDVLRFQATGRTTSEVVRASQAALLEMRAYLRSLAAARRAQPQDDLLSLMAQAEDQGDKLTEEEMLSTCVTLMVAGHETTTNLIANGLWLLLNHPEQLALLRAQPHLMPGAIEEFLRYESPIQRNRRRAAQDFTFGGAYIREGQIVMQMIAAANRDPQVFTDPGRLDIRRDPNPHIAFGMGIHFCLGAPLARLEGPIALAALIERFPKMRLASQDVQWVPGTMRAMDRLLVQW
jgi:hypothetical protein